jgi:cold shock CspA family protein
MLNGTVVNSVGAGCWVIEVDGTRDCVFVHQRYVVRRKFLHENDRVRFNLASNPRTPGENMAVNVEIVGFTVAIQVSDPAVRS